MGFGLVGVNANGAGSGPHALYFPDVLINGRQRPCKKFVVCMFDEGHRLPDPSADFSQKVSSGFTKK